MASNAIQGFVPSKSGFHFANSFPAAPVKTFSIPSVGEIGIGDASGGLCGGMVFAARDFFEANVAPPPADPAGNNSSPAPGTKLFNYLVDRLFDSFDIPSGVLRYFELMALPDDDDELIRGVVHRTLNDSWPQVKSDIDAGDLSPLGIVTRQSLNPEELKFNHQVLAYGYDVSEDGAISIQVYDPNHPEDDNVTITISSDPGAPAIGYSDGQLKVRAFFRSTYSPGDVADAI